VLVTGVNGINFTGGQGNTIGGTAPGQGNVIGGFQFGVFVGGGSSTGNVIQGNRIGIGVNGSPIPNHLAGIYVNGSGSTTIGGENPGEGNIIAFNGYPGTSAVPGVAVVNTTRNKISRNSIHNNAGLGIDLSVGTIADGVTANDHCDADTGANDLQNYPVITSVTNGSSTRVQGTLDSIAATSYRLEFFANTVCHRSGYGEGQAFMGFLDVVTDVNCSATFDVTFSFATNPGQPVTATATDSHGSTSEFCACVPTGHYFTVPPCRVADTRNPPGPSGGPALAANTFRTFPVTGLCGIPSTATAVAINLAVFLPTDTGDLRVYPAGLAAPLASSINFRPGIVRANNAVVLLGAGGQLSVQCDMPGGGTNFFFDVFGYFR
jgi:hypothetical protein